MRKEDAGGGLGCAEEEDRAPQVEAGEAEGGAAELGCQETVAVDATADAGIMAEAGPARTEEASTKEAVATGVIAPRLATDEVAVGEPPPPKRPLARLARKNCRGDDPRYGQETRKI
jgi:hypothetical protein